MGTINGKQCQPGPPVNRKPFNESKSTSIWQVTIQNCWEKNLDSCIESTWIYIMASLFELFWATDICLHAGNWSNIPDLWICGIDAHRPHSRKSQQYSFRITHCWGWNTTSPPADSMYFTYEAGSICRQDHQWIYTAIAYFIQFCSAINQYIN